MNTTSIARIAFLCVALVSVLASPGARAAPRTFTLVSGEVTFEIDAPLDTIGGSSRGVGGAVVIDPQSWTTTPTGRIEIDLTSFRTGIDLRDEDLRDQFFEAQKFAMAELSLTSLDRPSVAALTPGTSAEVVIQGTLGLHGVTRAVTIPARVTFDETTAGARVRITGDTVIPLEEHGMKRPKRLLFKLGKEVRVHIVATFRAPPASALAAVAAAAGDGKPGDVGAADALPPPAAVIVARPPDKKPPPAWRFDAAKPEGRGERLAVDARIGGDKNHLSCRSCHGITDERRGIFTGKTVPPSSSLWGAARRPSLWQGLAPTPAAAASLCAKIFMLKPQGLDEATAADLGAYLAALSPDPAPAHDWATMHASRRSHPANLEAGDVAAGKKLTEVYCAACHKKGGVRPALEPGLYERAMLVDRVRRRPGADNLQMPPIPLDRLTDSELRDIVAYLADDKQRIFVRRKTGPGKTP